MILRSIIVLLLSVYFVTAIDDPQYIQTSDGGEISLKNENSIINVAFTYSPDGVEAQTVNAELGDDNQWRARIDGLKPQKKVEYYATVNTDIGTETSKVQEWTTASLMPLPPRRMRGAVIFREDFNGQHLNLNNWMIDVTATGDWVV
ncbi:hypothetical protein LOTGIDRAFT_163568 [Lottia gigantea]|uniref:Uncharacterized protein n=1 Tax=Lottia gigantea TaxID=225164 RepID=V4BQA0_LOTGI|nr:hypothetical protein LOTGIDRAFT_163568 [Lottia gigantea]ESO91049.1 hypothetical protein LOTGIDRAFT_163568 [Lottia gigantea]